MEFPQNVKKELGVLVWPSGLRIWCCHCSGLGLCCGTGWIPGLGISICCGCSQKKIFLKDCHMIQRFYFYSISGYLSEANKNTNSKRYLTNKFWRGCGEKGPSYTVGGTIKLVQPLWKTVWRYLRKLNIEQPM